MPVGLGDGSPARSSVNVVQMEKTTSGPSQAIPLSETIENAHTKSAAVVLGSFLSAPKVGLSHPPARKMPLGDAPRPPPEWAKPSLDSPVFDEPQPSKTIWTKKLSQNSESPQSSIPDECTCQL